jgi:hypothetical protein
MQIVCPSQKRQRTQFKCGEMVSRPLYNASEPLFVALLCMVLGAPLAPFSHRSTATISIKQGQSWIRVSVFVSSPCASDELWIVREGANFEKKKSNILKLFKLTGNYEL